MGYVEVSYNRLVEVFGEPHDRMGDKTTVEWAFEHEGEKFTIYDYKWQSCQNDTVESFHIGGKTQRAVELVWAFLAEEEVEPINPEGDRFVGYGLPDPDLDF